MRAFLHRFGNVVRGVLSGFDRLFFKGTLRNLAYQDGLRHYLWSTRVLHKDFDKHSRAVSQQLEQASLQHARELGRDIEFLNSAKISPETVAKEIAAQKGIREGLICVLRRVDPCKSFEIHASHRTQKLEITYRRRQCVHLYHYHFHPLFGFMHARIQTWFPFHVHVCINGHDWLARQMDQAGLRYQRHDNCFTWIEDLGAAQTLFDQQLQAHWPSLLGELAASLNPIHNHIFARYPTKYYWTLAQSEWSSDVLFRTRADLLAIYPRLIRHAITTYGAVDVLRFLGRKLSKAGLLPNSFNGEVESDLKERQEGVRIKHWLNGNTLKLYDKGSVLRPEVTIYHPEEFKVYRPTETDSYQTWRPMRLGVADFYRRAQVCQAANARYLDALAAVQDTTPLRTLAEPLCRRVLEPRRLPTPLASVARPQDAVVGTDGGNGIAAPPTPSCPSGTDSANAARSVDGPAPPPDERALVADADRSKRRRLRALNPLSADDSNLLQAVSRHEFIINGLRNRDVRRLLFPIEPQSKADDRRRSAAISRKLRLLRAHGLLRKIPKTHRYMVSATGRKVITALLAARDASADLLVTNAA